MDIVGIIAIIVAVIAVIFVLVFEFIKIKKMTKEERVALLKSFVCGAIVKAEQEIGGGHGDEKLKQVEDYFNEKAPMAYKIILRVVGKDNLKEIIEMALAEIKSNFAK